jgi:endopeptidase Clp ATP-binding regulatory subunit ClpX
VRERPVQAARPPFHFALKPRDISQHLDRFVICQDEAKKVLAVALCDHFQHVRMTLEGQPAPFYVKQNVLLLGPTGVGKTHLIRSAAELIGVPFVKADATKFSETGYMGGDVEDLIRDLVQRANGDISRAQHGIVYVDEIDKIASRENGARDVSGRGVQINLLKLMEDAEVTVASPTGSGGGGAAASGAPGNGTQPTTIQTGQILFIVSGAFAGLSRQISQRLGQGHDGDWNAALLDQARTQDFIQFGFEPEFIGRLPVRVACQPLSADDLYRVMRESESSLLRQYERAFAAYDIRVRFRADGLRAIAKLAASEQTGARGLMTVCERVLRHFKFELPSTSIRELLVDRALVENPLVRLEQVLGQATLQPLTVGKKTFGANNLRTTAKKGLSKTE